MKVLLLTTYGDGLKYAERLSKEGHDVFFYAQNALQDIDQPSERLIRVSSWRPYMQGIDVILADGVFFETHWRLLLQFCAKVIALEMYGAQLVVENLIKSNPDVRPRQRRMMKMMRWWVRRERNG
ncbi:hypothetical protein LCGC14_2178370 [marine sediment metagenome]|uniref:Uncharacterized protein n=1 Tax=marine sediment metagenome TaxID=412755 RepID=A0A0F9EA69_9ZZZZ